MAMEVLATILGLLESVKEYAVATAVVGGLGSLWINHRLGLATEKLKVDVKKQADVDLERVKAALKSSTDMDIETHKSALSRANSLELEALKSQLQLSILERQVKLSRVFELQARAIAETYERLVLAEQSMRDLLGSVRGHGPIPHEKPYNEFQLAFGKYFEHFEKNRLFMSSGAEKLHDDLAEAYTEFSAQAMIITGPEVPGDGDIATLKWKTRQAAWDTVQARVRPLRLRVASEYRRILGTLETNEGPA